MRGQPFDSASAIKWPRYCARYANIFAKWPKCVIVSSSCEDIICKRILEQMLSLITEQIVLKQSSYSLRDNYVLHVLRCQSRVVKISVCVSTSYICEFKGEVLEPT